MAFKLTKEQLTRRGDLVTELQAASADIEKMVDELNVALGAEREKVEKAVTAYNELLAKAIEFRDEIVADAKMEFDERSEKWCEGERGQAASEWKDSWENLDLDDYEVELPEDIDFTAPDHATELEGMSDDFAAE